ncbi:hypothetical protein E308F_28480 [Moorella sp. E308F]|nr:hypothetical protein E308F_28480 [Moorella sp. E308F]
MAKVTAPLMSLDASGALGKALVFCPALFCAREPQYGEPGKGPQLLH